MTIFLTKHIERAAFLSKTLIKLQSYARPEWKLWSKLVGKFTKLIFPWQQFLGQLNVWSPRPFYKCYQVSKESIGFIWIMLLQSMIPSLDLKPSWQVMLHFCLKATPLRSLWTQSLVKLTKLDHLMVAWFTWSKLHIILAFLII